MLGTYLWSIWHEMEKSRTTQWERNMQPHYQWVNQLRPLLASKVELQEGCQLSCL